VHPTLRLVGVPSRGDVDSAPPVAFRPVLVEAFTSYPIEPEVVSAPITPLRREAPRIDPDHRRVEQQRIRRRAHSARMLRRRVRALGACGLALAMFCGLWLGTSAMASSARGQLQVLTGSEKTAHGYLYRVQPGDTMWSIATRLDPAGDPRPIADALQSELGGTNLQVGSELRVP
jgi:hypothetical protein